MLLTIIKNMFRTRSPILSMLATVYEMLDHRWDGSILRCPCREPKLNLTIEVLDRGRVVGRLRVATCVDHDIG